MKSKVKYCTMCKKYETRGECSYGPKIWDRFTLEESVKNKKINKGKIADTILGVAFATGAMQSPYHFVKTGHIESPGVALMQTWSKKRNEAERNLDSGRVSHPARNRKNKVNEEISIDKNTLLMMIIKKLINEKKRKNYLLNYGYIGESKTPAWTRNAGKDLVKGGLNRKGIASYRRENPGSKLSMAVTTKPSKLKKGSKSWKRRKSYCSRSAGQMKMWPKAAKDPNSRLRLARKKWNC